MNVRGDTAQLDAHRQHTAPHTRQDRQFNMYCCSKARAIFYINKQCCPCGHWVGGATAINAYLVSTVGDKLGIKVKCRSLGMVCDTCQGLSLISHHAKMGVASMAICDAAVKQQIGASACQKQLQGRQVAADQLT